MPSPPPSMAEDPDKVAAAPIIEIGGGSVRKRNEDGEASHVCRSDPPRRAGRLFFRPSDDRSGMKPGGTRDLSLERR